MLPQEIKAYFSFTRKERIGVLFLVLIIILLFVVPVFFKPAMEKAAPETFQKYKPYIERFRARNLQQPEETVKIDKAGSAALFYFDPNQLSATGWNRLGLPDKTIHTIQHYLEKGGKFLRPEDLAKIYGIPDAAYKRLAPYVRIADRYKKREPGQPFFQHNSFVKKDSFNFYHSHKQAHLILDINLADAEAWAGLPGIGSRLATRITHFREKLGGFYQAEQVKETYGLPDSVYERIKSMLVIKEDRIKKIDLNTAAQSDLQQHPYIRWALAKAIVNYRSMHGGFRSVNELEQLAAIDETGFRKLEPYISVGQ